MSDTPRTDGAEWTAHLVPADDVQVVRVEFARTLERELEASESYAIHAKAVVEAARPILGMGGAVIREVASGQTYNLCDTANWQILAKKMAEHDSFCIKHYDAMPKDAVNAAHSRRARQDHERRPAVFPRYEESMMPTDTERLDAVQAGKWDIDENGDDWIVNDFYRPFDYAIGRGATVREAIDRAMAADTPSERKA